MASFPLCQCPDEWKGQGAILPNQFSATLRFCCCHVNLSRLNRPTARFTRRERQSPDRRPLRHHDASFSRHSLQAVRRDHGKNLPGTGEAPTRNHNVLKWSLMNSPAFMDNLRVVLVATRNPLNIGAAARAMSNFGCTHLRLVNPYDPAYREARSAVGAAPVLANAEQFSTVAEAVADCAPSGRYHRRRPPRIASSALHARSRRPHHSATPRAQTRHTRKNKSRRAPLRL